MCPLRGGVDTRQERMMKASLPSLGFGPASVAQRGASQCRTGPGVAAVSGSAGRKTAQSSATRQPG